MNERSTRRAFLKGLAGSLGFLVIEGCRLPTATSESTPPATIPGFNEYLAFWEGRVGLRSLRPGQSLSKLLAQGDLEIKIEYQGKEQLFLDWLWINQFLNQSFPYKLKSTPPQKIGWSLTFIDREEDLPKFARTNLRLKAEKVLQVLRKPPEIESITPLTFTYHRGGNSYQTLMQFEPGRLSLRVAEPEGEKIRVVPEKENEWLARSWRASLLFGAELLKAKAQGGPHHLLDFPILEITCPVSQGPRICPVFWGNSGLVQPSFTVKPDLFRLFPAPANFQFPPQAPTPKPQPQFKA